MDYTESEQQEIELMAEYTALYYGPRPGFSRVPSLLRPLSWTWVISGILGSSVIWQGRSLTRIQTTGQWGLGRKQPRRTLTTSTCAAPRLCYPQQNIVSSLAGKVMEDTKLTRKAESNYRGIILWALQEAPQWVYDPCQCVWCNIFSRLSLYQKSSISLIIPLKNPALCLRPLGTDFLGGLKGNCKKVLNGSENSENKKKYGVAEHFPKKCHDLEPNGIVHN